MKILEFGDTKNPKIILIHGFQSPYQVWDKYIKHYQKSFHIIVPVLPGHDPEQKEDFTSFQQAARELEDYYISRYGENVYAVCAMSMGGVLTAVMWQNKRLNIEKIILDGSPLVSYSSFVKKMFLNFYFNVTHKTQQRDKKTVEQAGSIISQEHLEPFLRVLDNMTDTTIINCVTGIGDYKLPADIDTPNAKIHFFHGTKANEMYAKKTAKYIFKNYPNAVIKCFKGKGHCENSILHPDIMIAELDKIL